MSSHTMDQARMKEMIMTFRVSELQLLLGKHFARVGFCSRWFGARPRAAGGARSRCRSSAPLCIWECHCHFISGFAGRNKNGKKHELQARALDLVRIRSQPMQAKIRELYKASQEAQQQLAMMPNGSAGAQYPGMPAAANQYSTNLSAAAAMMGLSSAYGSAAAALQGRNPYTTGSGSGYQHAAAAAAGGHFATAASGGLHPQASQPPNTFQMSTQLQQRGSMAPQAIFSDTKFVKLPFYDNHAELLRPSSLVSQGNNRFQEANFQFFLSPSQATDIAANRDISLGSNCDYLYQLQLRFCQLTVDGKEGKDEFPPSICVHVNGKMASLPNPIPTNKPGQEPKRPPRPVNITHLCKLSPILPNNVSVKWGAEYGKG
jgi:hypothetical protein